MKEKILVVEADKLLRESLIMFLADYQYEVIDVQNIDDAELIVLREDVDLILTDISSEVNGFVLAIRLRAKDFFMPIIGLTIYNISTQDLVLGYKLSGLDLVFNKPTEYDELIKAIKITLLIVKLNGLSFSAN